MASRMTNAQKEALREAQLKADWENVRLQWNDRLLNVVLEAMKYPYAFVLSSTSDYVELNSADCYEEATGLWSPVAVARKVSEQQRFDYLYALEDAERAVQRYKDFLQEVEAKAAKRQAALNKLSKEEKELLGLTNN